VVVTPTSEPLWNPTAIECRAAVRSGPLDESVHPDTAGKRTTHSDWNPGGTDIRRKRAVSGLSGTERRFVVDHRAPFWGQSRGSDALEWYR